MKKSLIIILFLISASAFAQRSPQPSDDRRPPKERVEAMKIGFLTNKLDLTSEEAKNFWPVYNKYQDELEDLRKSRRDLMRDNPDSMTDQEIEKSIDGFIAFRQNEVDIIKKYHPQFKKILPPGKVAKLYRAEEEFKRELLEQLRERRGNDGPRPEKRMRR